VSARAAAALDFVAASRDKPYERIHEFKRFS
jgi:hypothetical protein